MKMAYKSRVVGSVVVLIALAIITLLVLSRKHELPKGLAVNDETHQVLSLPLINETQKTNWHARQSQQIDLSHPVLAQAEAPQQPVPAEPKPEPEPNAQRPVQTKVATAPSVLLQVASFSSFRNAHILSNKLSSLGYMPHIKMVRIHNKSWYRLTAGPFKTKDQARLVQRVIQQKWGVSSKIRVAH